MAHPNQAQTRRLGIARNVSPPSEERVAQRTPTREKLERQHAPTVRPPSRPAAAASDEDDREEDRDTPIYPRFALATRVSLADDADAESSPGRYLAQDVAEESLGAAKKSQASAKRTRPTKRGSVSREDTALRGARPDARAEASELPARRGK